MAGPIERSFDFLRINEREGKPRKAGITEIRGPYYAPVGKRYLADILETMGAYVDIFKFSAGSFSPSSGNGGRTGAQSGTVTTTTSPSSANAAPPARDVASTRPSVKRVAVWNFRPIFRLPVSVQVPLEGS